VSAPAPAHDADACADFARDLYVGEIDCAKPPEQWAAEVAADTARILNRHRRDERIIRRREGMR